MLPPCSRLAGHVSVAVSLALSGVSAVVPYLMGLRVLADTPPVQIVSWLGCAGFLLGILLTVLEIRKRLQPDPPLERRFASVERVDGMEEAWEQDARETTRKIEKLEKQLEGRHAENVAHLKTIEGKLERNYDATQQRQDKLLADVRHEVRGELQSAEIKAEARFEKQIDRFTDVVRGLGRVEGGRA